MSVIMRHEIREFDTLPLIASMYLNDASRWLEIAVYNKLTPPYIDTTTTVRKEKVRASGYCTVVLDIPEDSSITIPGKTLIAQVPRVDIFDKRYITTATVTASFGELTKNVPIECEFAGPDGNTAAGTITELLYDISEIVSIVNNEPILGGEINNIKVLGDVILIPMEIGTVPDIENYQEYINRLGRQDLDLDFLLSDINMIDNFYRLHHDLVTKRGLPNIVQSLQSRLQTELGELIHHPDYGSGVFKEVGTALPYAEKLIEIEILRVIYSDGRVQHVDIQKISREGTGISVECGITLAGQRDAERLNLLIPYKFGGS